MARSIVIEWDPRRALVAVGTGGAGSKPAIQRTVAFELARGSDVDSLTLAESLAAKLNEHKVGRGDATVVVERSVAELRVLLVPPVPTEELPGIVRFQAAREFSSFTEDWLLDYVPLPPLATGQGRVLAAAISPQVAAQIRGCCEKAGLNLQRVVLRPFAAAKLLVRAGFSQGSTLLVERLVDSVELTVLVDGAVQLARSCRVAFDASDEGLVKQVLGEVRRTVTAYRNQQHNGTLDRILVMADPATTTALIEPLGEALGVPVDPLDPATTFGIFGSVKSDTPNDGHRFAAVFGAFGEPVADAADAIDFLNPTRPPDPPSKRTRNILIGTAAAAVVLAVAALYWLENSRLNRELDALRREIAEMAKDDEGYQDRMAEVAMIDQWVSNRLPWPEMIDRLSRRLPLPDDAIVDNLTFSVDDKQRVASVGIQGRVANPSMIKRIEDDIREPERGIEITGKTNIPTNREPYKFTFDETVMVDLSKLAEARAAADASLPAETEATPAPVAPAEASGAEPAVAESPVVTGNAIEPETPESEPTGDEPTSEEPASEEPAGDEPASDEPASDEPLTEEPTSDEPGSDEPGSEEPQAEEPASDEPTGEEPTGEEPSSDEPAGEKEDR